MSNYLSFSNNYSSYGSKGDNSTSEDVEVKDFANHGICKSY